MKRKFIFWLVLVSFVFNMAAPYTLRAEIALPGPQPHLINTTALFSPLAIKGLKLYSNDPFKFDFMIEEGNTAYSDTQLKTEAQKLIEYFLVSLTVPEKDLWVNLSPYEKQRVIPEELSRTGMGTDMLGQDYVLKQLASSLTYPDSELGKAFWDKIHARAKVLYGNDNVAVNNFNRIWIVPQKAVVYTDKDKAYVGEATLKVMMEEDYLAAQKNNPLKTSDISTQTMREVIIPVIEEEVNNGKNFTQLRQMYKALILAAWFKKHLKDSIVNQLYADQNKVHGVDTSDPNAKEKIYNQYLQACKDGVYNYVKREQVSYNKITKRQYFSGGLGLVVDPVLQDHPADTLSDAQRAVVEANDGVVTTRLKDADVPQGIINPGVPETRYQTINKFRGGTFRSRAEEEAFNRQVDRDEHELYKKGYFEKPKLIDGTIHGLYVNEGINGRRVIYVNHNEIVGYLEHFERDMDIKGVNEEQVRRYIDGHETLHALLDHLRSRGANLSSIDDQAEEDLADIFGLAFSVGISELDPIFVEELTNLGKLVNVGLVNLIKTSPKSLEGLLERLGVSVDIEIKTPAEMAQIKAAAEASGHTVKPMVSEIMMAAGAVAAVGTGISIAKDIRAYKARRDFVRDSVKFCTSHTPEQIKKMVMSLTAMPDDALAEWNINASRCALDISTAQALMISIKMWEPYLSKKQKREIIKVIVKNVGGLALDNIDLWSKYFDKAEAKEMLQNILPAAGACPALHGNRRLMEYFSREEISNLLYSDLVRFFGHRRSVGDIIEFKEYLADYQIVSILTSNSMSIKSAVEFAKKYKNDFSKEAIASIVQHHISKADWYDAYKSAAEWMPCLDATRIRTIMGSVIAKAPYTNSVFRIAAEYGFYVDNDILVTTIQKALPKCGNFDDLADFQWLGYLDKARMAQVLLGVSPRYIIQGADKLLLYLGNEDTAKLVRKAVLPDILSKIDLLLVGEHRWARCLSKSELIDIFKSVPTAQWLPLLLSKPEYFYRLGWTSGVTSEENRNLFSYLTQLSQLGPCPSEWHDITETSEEKWVPNPTDWGNPSEADATIMVTRVVGSERNADYDRYQERYSKLQQQIQANAPAIINSGRLIEIMAEACLSRPVQSDLARSKIIANIIHGLYINEGGSHRVIYVNHDELVAYSKDFARDMGLDNVTEEQARKYIDGHETLHALLDHLRNKGVDLKSIDVRSEENLADIFGLAFAMGIPGVEGILLRQLVDLSQLINLDLVAIIETHPKTLEALLEKLGVSVDVEVMTPAEMIKIKEAAEAAGHAVKPMIVETLIVTGVAAAVAVPYLLRVKHAKDFVRDSKKFCVSNSQRVVKATILGLVSRKSDEVDYRDGFVLIGSIASSMVESVDEWRKYFDDKQVAVMLNSVLSKSLSYNIVEDILPHLDRLHKLMDKDEFVAMLRNKIPKLSLSKLLSYAGQLEGFLGKDEMRRNIFNAAQVSRFYTDDLNFDWGDIEMLSKKISRDELTVLLNRKVPQAISRADNSNADKSVFDFVDKWMPYVDKTKVVSAIQAAFQDYRAYLPDFAPCFTYLDQAKVCEIVSSQLKKINHSDDYVSVLTKIAPYLKDKAYLFELVSAVAGRLSLDKFLELLGKGAPYPDKHAVSELVSSAVKSASYEAFRQMHLWLPYVEEGLRARMVKEMLSSAVTEAASLPAKDLINEQNGDHGLHLADAAFASVDQWSPYVGASETSRILLNILIKVSSHTVVFSLDKSASYIPHATMSKYLRDALLPPHDNSYILNGWPNLVVNAAEQLRQYFSEEDFATILAKAKLQSARYNASASSDDSTSDITTDEGQYDYGPTSDYMSRFKIVANIIRGLFVAQTDGTQFIYVNYDELESQFRYFAKELGILLPEVTIEKAKKFIDGHETFHALMHKLRSEGMKLRAIDKNEEERLADIFGRAFALGYANVDRTTREELAEISQRIDIDLASFLSRKNSNLEFLLEKLGISVTVEAKSQDELETIRVEAKAAGHEVRPMSVKRDVGGIDYQQGLNIEEKGKGIGYKGGVNAATLDSKSFRGFTFQIISIERKKLVVARG